MECYICFNEPDQNVPLLKCGHYVCPRCYCALKSNRFYKCQLCQRKLVRGQKKNI